MIKKITGSWFEFTHHNAPEGKYWNPICRRFTKEQWQEKIREMSSLGMKYIVLLCTSLVRDDMEEAYFKTDIYPFAKDFTCTDPIGAIMEEADKLGMKVFMSVGYYGNWAHTYENMTSPDVQKLAFKAMEQIYSLYGHHSSFFGWYMPDESCIDGHFSDEFMKYVNDYTAFGRSFDSSLKSMIAPYGTNILKADDKYAGQLELLDTDYIAYQDEVGVHKSQPEQTEAYYAALRKVHDKAGRSALWADMELFDFEETVYRSALVPSNIERLEKQLLSISPYVDEVLCYQYMGMMNKPGTIAFCGHPDSIDYYITYKNLIDQKVK